MHTTCLFQLGQATEGGKGEVTFVFPSTGKLALGSYPLSLFTSPSRYSLGPQGRSAVSLASNIGLGPITPECALMEEMKGMDAGAQMWKHCVVSGVCREKGAPPPFPPGVGGSHASSASTTPTFQQPFVWCEVLDISFPRVKHRQYDRISKLEKQSPLSDFSQ